MPRTMTVSALFAAGLFAAAALGQPPGGTNPIQPPKGKKPPPDEKAKPADPTDAAVKAALANDPDVQVARAKLLLAEAELGKARQAVVLKVMTLKATIQEQKLAVEAARERVAWASRMEKLGYMEQRQVLMDREKMVSAEAALARAQKELDLLTGGGGKELGVEVSPAGNAETVARAIEWLMKTQDERVKTDAGLQFLSEAVVRLRSVKGPIPDRIRAALDKSVKLGAKGEKVNLRQALEVFKKEAGLDATVRGPVDEFSAITSDGEELPVGAWFQLFEDYAGLPNEFFQAGAPAAQPRKARFYVRDYGLLVAPADAAPPEAPTLTEFWKQRPPGTGERRGKEAPPKGK
jgi:hypothetical protein